MKHQVIMSLDEYQELQDRIDYLKDKYEKTKEEIIELQFDLSLEKTKTTVCSCGDEKLLKENKNLKKQINELYEQINSMIRNYENI